MSTKSTGHYASHTQPYPENFGESDITFGDFSLCGKVLSGSQAPAWEPENSVARKALNNWIPSLLRIPSGAQGTRGIDDIF